MASADYLLCVRCDNKAVYDADWYHRVDPDGDNGRDGKGWKGEVQALCEVCAENFELVLRPKRFKLVVARKAEL